MKRELYLLRVEEKKILNKGDSVVNAAQLDLISRLRTQFSTPTKKFKVSYFCDSSFGWDREDNVVIIDAADAYEAKQIVETSQEVYYGNYCVTGVEEVAE